MLKLVMTISELRGCHMPLDTSEHTPP